MSKDKTKPQPQNVENLLRTATLGIKIKRRYPTNQGSTKSQKFREVGVLSQRQKKDKKEHQKNNKHRQNRFNSFVYSLRNRF